MNNKKILWGAIGVLAIIVVVLLARGGSAPAVPTGGDTTTNTQTQTTQKGGATAKPTGGTNTQTSGGTTKTTAPKPSSGITFITPAAGAQWTLGELHEIKWSRESGYSGYLSLLNASTKAVVGIITPSLGSSQNTMQWDTQNVSVSRINPTRITIPVGSYIIRATFDGPIAAAESPAFSVSYSGPKATSHTITLNKFAFDPPTTRINKGEPVTFKNNDTISYAFYFSGLRVFSLAPGASETYNTLGLTPGVYDLYSEVYTSLKGSVIVQ